MKLSGRAWKIGNNIGAQDIIPSKYDKLAFENKFDELATHLLEDKDPSFASKVQKGDIIVAGENLGSGHAHYFRAAFTTCRTAGISALLSDKADALFSRGAIDSGYPVLSFKGISSLVNNGDTLEIDFTTGAAKNVTTGKTMQFEPISNIIVDILDAGGTWNWALRSVGA